MQSIHTFNAEKRLDPPKDTPAMPGALDQFEIRPLIGSTGNVMPSSSGVHSVAAPGS